MDGLRTYRGGASREVSRDAGGRLDGSAGGRLDARLGARLGGGEGREGEDEDGGTHVVE